MGSVFSSYHDTHALEAPSPIDTLTDEEVLTLIEEAGDDALLDKEHPTSWKITSNLVAKTTSFPTESYMMSYVSSHTSIPIPKVHRSIPDEDDIVPGMWIIMDYIDGMTLQQAWPIMSWWKKLRAIWTIRGYIRQLQKVPIPNKDVPGPFNGSGQCHPCWGYYFTEYSAGPFRSYLDMAGWFDRRRFQFLASQHAATGIIHPKLYPKFDISHPLVLCHMDLHGKNFIIDRKGKIWLVDWGISGAYPAWLEYAIMVRWAERGDAPRIWTFLARFMVGNYAIYKTGYLDRLRVMWETYAEDHFPQDYFSKYDSTID